MKVNALTLAAVRAKCQAGTAKRLRMDAQLSLAESAAAVVELARSEVTCSPSTVQRWEDGRLRPSGVRGLAYARLLAQIEAQLATEPVDVA